MSPIRVQRRRTKGWRTPLCSCGCGKPARYVGRGTKWGNPFVARRCTCCGYWEVYDDNGVDYLVDHQVARQHPELANDRAEAVERAVELFVEDFEWCARITRDEVRAELRGHDLMCWCPLEDAEGNRVPCHADVLLELANQGDPDD